MGKIIDQLKAEGCIVDNDAGNRAVEIIRQHSNDGWIPAKKALPPEPPEYVDDEDDLEEYIVMIDGAERPTTLRYAGDGTWWEDGTYYPVTAWRPLPEPYRTERSESKAMREIGKVIISGIEAGIHQGVRENEQG